MTWVRLSDQTAAMEALNESGWDAELLWYKTLTVCAAVGEGAGNDGLITPFMLRTTAALPAKPIPYRKAAPKLVAAGLWHDVHTVRRCVDCMDHGGDRCADGAFFIHEWWEHLLSSAGKHDPIARDHERRGKRLDRRPDLKAMVRSRDRDRCRYCGIKVVWTDGRGGDRRSKNAGNQGTFDHVDPFGGNSPSNLVVACRRCNGRKKDCTPEEAGMELLPEPAPYQSADQPDQTANQSTDQTADQPAPSRARETGRGLVGPGSDRAAGLVCGLVGGVDPAGSPRLDLDDDTGIPDLDTDTSPHLQETRA